MIPVYLINLPRDSDRLQHMRTQLDSLGIPFSVVEGIDGLALSYVEAKPHMDRVQAELGRVLTPGELGCALTHMRVLELIKERQEPMACVLEDDVTLSPDIVKFLDADTLASMPKFHILRLFSHSHRQRKRAWSMQTLFQRSIVAPMRIGWGMYGQVYTWEAAKAITALPIRGPIDNMLYYDGGLRGLRTLEIRPSLIEMNDFGTSTAGWEEWPRSRRLFITTKLSFPLAARLNFFRTWGLRGLAGLLRSNYSPSA